MVNSVLMVQTITAKKRGIFLFWLLSVLLSFSYSDRAMCQGNLMVMPKRLVFDGKQKIQNIYLANTGNDTAYYTISCVNLRRKGDGTTEIISVPDSGQHFADTFLRFYPKQVALWPQKTQVIKVQTSRFSDLNPGEYCSQIYFRSVPKAAQLPSPDTSKNQKGVTIKLNAVYGITIPAIIRVGPTDSKVVITDIELKKDSAGIGLSFIIHRTGTMSVYGELIVKYISKKGKVIELDHIKGYSVYPPNESRIYQSILKKLAKEDFNTGKLQITYENYEEGQSDMLAEAEFQLG